MFKVGQKVRISTIRFDGEDWSETGTIMRWTKVMGPRDSLPVGYYPVRYDSDSGKLMIHETSLKAA